MVGSDSSYIVLSPVIVQLAVITIFPVALFIDIVLVVLSYTVEVISTPPIVTVTVSKVYPILGVNIAV